MTRPHTTTDAADPTPGEAALRAALAEHGEDVAAALDRTDQVKDVLDLAVLTIAAADDDDVEHVTESLASLIAAIDALSTDETAALAAAVADNAEDVTDGLETVLRLQRDDALADLVTLAETLSDLEVDPDTVRGLNRLLGAVEGAEAAAEPIGLRELIGAIRSPDVRLGLGYLLAVLRGQGRSLREDR